MQKLSPCSPRRNGNPQVFHRELYCFLLPRGLGQAWHGKYPRDLRGGAHVHRIFLRVRRSSILLLPSPPQCPSQILLPLLPHPLLEGGLVPLAKIFVKCRKTKKGEEAVRFSSFYLDLAIFLSPKATGLWSTYPQAMITPIQTLSPLSGLKHPPTPTRMTVCDVAAGETCFLRQAAGPSRLWLPSPGLPPPSQPSRCPERSFPHVRAKKKST